MSRQSEYHRRRDLLRLRERAEAAPIAVGFDEARHRYTVVWAAADDYPTELCAGRHEVVCAYIDGFVRAWVNRPLMEHPVWTKA